MLVSRTVGGRTVSCMDRFVETVHFQSSSNFAPALDLLTHHAQHWLESHSNTMFIVPFPHLPSCPFESTFWSHRIPFHPPPVVEEKSLGFPANRILAPFPSLWIEGEDSPFGPRFIQACPWGRPNPFTRVGSAQEDERRSGQG